MLLLVMAAIELKKKDKGKQIQNQSSTIYRWKFIEKIYQTAAGQN